MKLHLSTLFFSLFLAAILFLASGSLLVEAQTTFESPINEDNPAVFLKNIIQYILSFIALLALLALIIGGARMMLSLGDEARLKNAKQVIFWAIAGLVVVILSFVVVQLVAKFLGVGI